MHTDARTAADTDWRQIVALYDQLVARTPTPVVALNRAVAVAEVEGAERALALIDALSLDGYAPFHATRADLLRSVGRAEQAGRAYERAAELSTDCAERAFLTARGRGRAGPPGTARR